MEWTERIGRRIKLRDLHILLAVAKTGSMGKAAAALAVSQPVVSKAISDLEHALSLRLFDRSPQGVEPTTYGRALLKWSVAVFDDLRQGVKELEYLTDPTVGELRIGSNEPMAAGFVSTVIMRLMRQHPRIAFHVVPADAITLISRELRQRSVELVVAPTFGLKPEADTNVEILFNDRRVVTAGAENKWVRRRKIALADLIDEPWVLPPLDSIPGMEIAEVFRASGLEPPSTQVFSWSLPLHYHLLATERFLTILPLSMLRLSNHLPFKVLPVELPMKLRSRPTGIITLKNRTLGPVAQLFIDCARKTANALAMTD
jgi:DNA-binding transcriptional LysR family regulator